MQEQTEDRLQMDQESEDSPWWDPLCLLSQGPWRPHSRVPSRSVELGAGDRVPEG